MPFERNIHIMNDRMQRMQIFFANIKMGQKLLKVVMEGGIFLRRNIDIDVVLYKYVPSNALPKSIYPSIL